MAFVVAWLLLAATAAAKALTLPSKARVMRSEDPVIGLSVRSVMVLASAVEVVACAALLVLRDRCRRGVVLLGLGAQFLAYHGARLMIAPHGLCPCLGSALKWLGLSEIGATYLALGIAFHILATGALLLAYARCDVK